MIKQNKDNPTNKILMPRAVAIWLIENTSLTFKQIAVFCNLHELDVKSLADGDQSPSLKGISPLETKETTLEAIRLSEADETLNLLYADNIEYDKYLKTSAKASTSKQSKYKRQSKPEAILWLLQHYGDLSDYQISKLLKSTASTVKSIRGKTHWNYKNLHPKNPVILGLCTEEALKNITE